MEQRRRAHSQPTRLLPRPSGQSLVHSQPRRPHPRAVTTGVGEAEGQRRLCDVGQEPGEVLLVLRRAGRAQSGPGHEVTERQGGGKLGTTPRHEGRDLVQHHVQSGVVLQQVMDLDQREPPPRRGLGRHVHA